MHCKPLSPGRQLIAPFTGGFSSQSTQGVACTDTYKFFRTNHFERKI